MHQHVYCLGYVSFVLVMCSLPGLVLYRTKMGDFSDFQRGQIVGVCLAGTSVTKLANLLGESRAAVSKVMKSYTHHGRTSWAKRNSGKKQKLRKRIAIHWRRLCLWIKEVPQQRWQQNLIFILKTDSTKRVWWERHKSNIHGRRAIAKPVITENNTKRWKRGHLTIGNT